MWLFSCNTGKYNGWHRKVKNKRCELGRVSWSNNSHFTSNDTNANKKKENDKLLKCRHINILAMVYMMVINPEAANFIYRTVISDLFYTEYITAA